jgi:hypothetical protein
MSVRFTASGQHYTRAVTAESVWSMVMWAYGVTDTDHGPFGFGTANAGGQAVFISRSGANTLKCFDLNNNGGGFGSFNYGPGRWFVTGLVVSGANCSWYHGNRPSDMTVDAVTNITSPTGSQTYFLGIDSFDAQWWRGKFGGVKIWNGYALTAAEMKSEACQLRPKRSAQLVQVHPFFIPEAIDHSGRGNSLSGGASVSTDDGPPIPWSVTRELIVLNTTGGPIVRGVTDNAAATDTISRVSAYVRSVSDTASATDSVGRVSARIRSVSDNAAATDTVTRVRVSSRAVGDSATATDAITRSSGRTRTVSDNAAASDGVVKLSTFVRSATDNAPAADVVSVQSGGASSRSVSDNAVASDSTSRNLQLVRNVADSCVAADSVSRAVLRSLGVTDSSPATDAVSRTLALGRVLGDGASATDTVQGLLGRFRGVTDSALASDVISANVGLVRGVADISAAVDTVGTGAYGPALDIVTVPDFDRGWFSRRISSGGWQAGDLS